MKKFLLTLIAALLFIPNIVFASTQATDLLETVKSIGLEPSTPDYQETDDQITIYLFRSSSCGHCHNLVTFLDSIAEEYGEMFKLRAYEVGSNQDNYKLKEKVVDYFDEDAPGVPYMVIGESTFYGFSDSSKEKIKKAIETEYKAKEKFDILEKLDEKKENKNENDALYVIIPVLGIIVISCIVKFLKSEN